MSTKFIDCKLWEYEQRRDSLEYRFRKQILDHVAKYLEFTYPRETSLVNTSEYWALQIIYYRIDYKHHYTQGF